MSDRAVLAMIQSFLGGSTSSEEVLLFQELARRLILSGLAINSSGTISVTIPVFTESALSLSDVTTNNVTSTQHGFAPKSPGDATQFLNGGATPGWSVPSVADSAVTFTDITTGDVTSTKHGYTPKTPADTTKFLRGGATADWAVPPVTTDVTLMSSDVTTNDVTSTKHGFAPKSPGSAAQFLNGAATPAFATIKSYDVVPATVTLTDGATPALDASLGRHFRLAAAGDRTIAVPTNAVAGMKITLEHFASGGARTLALNTGAGGFRYGTDITALSQTASGKTDYIGCIYNATDSFWDVIAYSKGY